MQFKLSRKTKWIAVGALVLCTAKPSFAIFGLGDIVFDPTSYGSLASQLSTLTKMYTTASSQYISFKNNIVNFSVKTQWQTALNSMKNVQVRNTYGETNGMTAALDQNSTTAATTAWTNSGVALSSNTNAYLAGESCWRQRQTHAACHRGNVRHRFTRLPKRRGFLPCRACRIRNGKCQSLQDNQLDGCNAHQQRGSAVEPCERITGSAAQRATGPGCAPCLHSAANDGAEHAAT